MGFCEEGAPVAEIPRQESYLDHEAWVLGIRSEARPAHLVSLATRGFDT